MSFATKYSPEQWAEARRLRAEGLSFTVIGERVGIKGVSVAARAYKQGWSRSAAAPSVVTAAARAGKPRDASPATAEMRRALALRLYGLIELRIRILELHMKKRLDAYEHSDAGAELPAMTKDERDAFAALIEDINQVTEMASEPASAASGRRKSVNRELTALSDDIDPHGLAVASEKDDLRSEIAEKLEKLLPPA